MTFLTVVFSLLLSFGARAKCQLSSPDQLLGHIQKNHPEIIAQKARTKAFKKEIDKASQSPNPKIELKSKTPDDNFADEGTVIGGEFKHTFELGGKRKARMNLSRSELRRQKIRAQNEKEVALQVATETVNRISQLNQLIPLYTESIQSFKELLNKLDNLPSKSPKEMVEKSTLQLVLEDYQIRKSQLEGKKKKLFSLLAFFVKDRCTLTHKLFSREANLKALPSSISKDLNKATEYQLAKNGVEKHKRKFDLEQSRGWSDLELGPTVEYSDPGFTTDKVLKVGLAFEFRLPIFHTNDGGKGRALKKLKEQRIRLKNEKKKLRLELKRQRENYESYRRELSKLQSLSEIKDKHEKIENLFSRGTISTGLIIEVHRQLTNWHHNKFYFQQMALKALWRIYELTGKTEQASY